MILIGPAACGPKPQAGITDDMRAEGQVLFGGTSEPAPPESTEPGSADATKPTAGARTGQRAATPESSADSGWAIALEYVSGPGHERTAAQRRVMLVRELGRNDISVRTRVDGSVVVVGSYPSVADTQAQADLDWVRSFRRGNAQPFVRAHLVPPKAEGADGGAHPEWDLVGIRATPAGAGRELTLQIAVFDGGGSVPRARRDAEAFTQQLRGAGEEAYFFHGPSLSVVTIGLFDAREADADGRPSSSAARAAQRAHPLNLRDGTEPITDARGEAQTSALMRIP